MISVTERGNQALPPCAIVKFACKNGESLVYFDHVLDVVGRGYPLTADFAHVNESITRPKAHLRGRKVNHVQPRPAHDQNIPRSHSLYTRT